MSEIYQATYEAVRSKVSGGSISDAAESSFREVFGHAGFLMQQAAQEHINAGYELQRPSVVFKPQIYQDGTQWCALLGDDIASGVCGFGETAQLAMQDFDKNFNTQKGFGMTTPTMQFRRYK